MIMYENEDILQKFGPRFLTEMNLVVRRICKNRDNEIQQCTTTRKETPIQQTTDNVEDRQMVHGVMRIGRRSNS